MWLHKHARAAVSTSFYRKMQTRCMTTVSVCGRGFKRCSAVHRFLTRLLLVHGYLADYRLQRLIKYSFYKNITFAFVFLFYQGFNGVSGQVMSWCFAH